MTELEKMTNGEPYDALAQEVSNARLRAHDLCHQLLMSAPSDLDARKQILKDLLPHAAEDAVITPPFFCDYGWNIHIGKRFYCNAGCVILDGAPVTIGDYVLLGPNVQIYTPIHDLDPERRAALIQWTGTVNVGDNVWIGGGAIICPNVSIEANSVIGAGSVVTRDIPAGVLAAGNPAKVIKKLI